MPRSTRLPLACLCVIVAGILAPTLVRAQSAIDEPISAQNGFTLRPYVWFPFMTGTSSLGSRSVDIDTNIFQIISKADQLYGFMGYGEYRVGKLSLYSDLVWAKVNLGTSVVRSANLIAGLNGTLVANANIWFDMVIADSGAAYEVAKWTRGVSGSLKEGSTFWATTAVDVTVGARYWYLKPDVELGVSGTIDIPALGLSRTGAGLVSASPTIDWVDPLIGFRLRHVPAPGRQFELRGDVGGFGVGAGITWQGVVGYSFDAQLLGHTVNNYVGYRALYIDYEQGSGARRLDLDLLQHGPVIGMNLKW